MKRTIVFTSLIMFSFFGLLLASFTAPAYTLPRRHSPKRLYSDEAITSLLLFASGPAAKAHPHLAADLRLLGARPKPSNVDAAVLTIALRKVDPNYHSKVVLGVQRDDPYAARAALSEVGHDVRVLSDQSDPGQLTRQTSVTPLGKSKAKILAIFAIAGLSVAVVYTNAAVATNAAIVLVVVPAYVSYSFDHESGSEIDQQHAAALLSKI